MNTKNSTRLFLSLLVSVVAYSASAKADSTLPRHVICLIDKANVNYLVDIPASVVLKDDGTLEAPKIATGDITLEGGPLVGEGLLQPLKAKSAVVHGQAYISTFDGIDLFINETPVDMGGPKLIIPAVQLTRTGHQQIYCSLNPDSQNDMIRQDREAAAAAKNH